MRGGGASLGSELPSWGRKGPLACFPSLSRYKRSHINTVLPLKLTSETRALGSEPSRLGRSCPLPATPPEVLWNWEIKGAWASPHRAVRAMGEDNCGKAGVHRVPCRRASLDFRGL